MASNEALDALRYDGNIYAIPYRNALKLGNGLIARADMLKELNLNTPTMIDEFTSTMKTIKKRKTWRHSPWRLPVRVRSLMASFRLPLPMV